MAKSYYPVACAFSSAQSLGAVGGRSRGMMAGLAYFDSCRFSRRALLTDVRMRTPKPLASVRDIRALQLSTAERLVLSCIDGVRTEADLAAATGQDGERLRASLTKLETQGLIAFDDGGSPAR
ncbi:MAG TPA: hypothetical protein VGY54_10560, partial [Polyangiaceae bacterium]|nr:hypothetical protein [Polyangiaceae bacterium]